MDRYCITKGAKLIDALTKLNNQQSLAMTLFVIDENNRMVGTVTDGDIRRALISGKGVDCLVDDVMHRNFYSLRDKDDIRTLKRLRERKIILVPRLDADKRILEVIDLSTRKSSLPVDAVLMAGGKGERLRPLTLHTPKPLLKIGDKAIIDRNVDRLIEYGIDHISVTVNYLKEQIEEHFERPRSGVKINCVSEPCYLGTIGSVKFVKHFYNDTILVMNSDLFTNINYEDFFLHFKDNDADMSVAAVPYRIAVPYGIMDLDGPMLKGLIEKPTYNYYANGGIYLLKREMLDLIPDGVFFNATDLINKLIKTNRRVVRFPINGTWIDIGNPQEYQKACDMAENI